MHHGIPGTPSLRPHRELRPRSSGGGSARASAHTHTHTSTHTRTHARTHTTHTLARMLSRVRARNTHPLTHPHSRAHIHPPTRPRRKVRCDRIAAENGGALYPLPYGAQRQTATWRDEFRLAQTVRTFSTLVPSEPPDAEPVTWPQRLARLPEATPHLGSTPGSTL